MNWSKHLEIKGKSAFGGLVGSRSRVTGLVRFDALEAFDPSFPCVVRVFTFYRRATLDVRDRIPTRGDAKRRTPIKEEHERL
jgi:hypothetical protein